MTALDDRHHLTPRVDVGALHADLAAAYQMLDQVDAEWVAEREWTRRLEVLLALAPYGRRPHLAGSLGEWAAGRAENGPPPPVETSKAWTRRICRGAR